MVGMRILVTGAAGFVGSWTVRRGLDHPGRLTLLAAGRGPADRPEASSADALTRLAAPFSDAGPRLEAFDADLADRFAAERLIRQARPDAIIHAAALTDTGRAERDPGLAHREIVVATRSLLAARDRFAPAARFIALSTDLVFDGRRPAAPTTPDVFHAHGMDFDGPTVTPPYRPSDPPSPVCEYARQKVVMERMVLASGRRREAHPSEIVPEELSDAGPADLASVRSENLVVRSALVFGPPAPSGKAGFLGWLERSLASGHPVDSFEDEYRTPVLVTDLADLLIALATRSHRSGEILHGGGPERLHRAELAGALCRARGWPESLVRRRRLAEVIHAAPRSPDVSLDSSATWTPLGLSPTGFTDWVGKQSLNR
jgi:dTDP-4-dehydrorhamnose reductase